MTGQMDEWQPTGQTWTTEEMRRDFEVLGFAYGVCVVRRRSDGQLGTLDFVHAPRVYHSFAADR